MPAIHAQRNQYLGINAHLHSFLQSGRGDWRGFHTNHLTDLTRAIERLLPAGYYALTEKSIQLQLATPLHEENTLSATIPDVLIARTAQSEPTTMTMSATAPTATLTVTETLSTEQDYFDAVVIYHEAMGEDMCPVTRIELLSPSNKPPNTHYQVYRQKREETLQSGIALVELDYLHETRSPIRNVPTYPRQPGSHPYMVIVSDPRPSLGEGPVYIYGFQVDQSIPAIAIPLADADSVTCDLGAVYNTTYEAARYYKRVVDYSQLPVNFDTYSAADQERIKQRIAIVQNAAQQGHDLESGPFLVDG